VVLRDPGLLHFATDSFGEKFAHKYLVWVGLYGGSPVAEGRERHAAEGCDPAQ
jgi:hypothetical protein